MTFFVLNPVAIPGIGFVALWWNAEIRIVIRDILTKGILSIGFICHDNRSVQIDMTENVFGNNRIMSIAGRKLNINRIPKRIYHSMDLCISAASGNPNALIFRIFCAFSGLVCV